MRYDSSSFGKMLNLQQNTRLVLYKKENQKDINVLLVHYGFSSFVCVDAEILKKNRP
jgi:hypothetical protein